jgi:hypothetical protein
MAAAARGWFGVAVFAATLLAVSPTPANGRFPSAQQLTVHPRDPNRIWMRATHGFLTSCNRGESWFWLCEQSVDYSGTVDPPFLVNESGALLVGIFSGLSVSRDNGCNFAYEPTIGPRYVKDVTVDRLDPRRMLAFTSNGASEAGVTRYSNVVWRSTDGGDSWQKLGSDLDETLVGLTLDWAPSDASTIYVTALAGSTAGDAGSESQGLLVRTTDAGETWAVVPIPETSGGWQPYLSAIDPNDPKKLYVRVRGPNAASADQFVENRLIYSDDAGQSWKTIFESRADMLGFALSPDGKEVLVGLGDSRALSNARPVDPHGLGLFASPTAAFAFELVSPDRWHIGCLTFEGDTLWVCTSQFAPVGWKDGPTPGFELGISRDRGRSIEKVMALADPLPMQCGCQSRTGKLCPEPWNGGICTTIGRCAKDGKPTVAKCTDPANPCEFVDDPRSEAAEEEGSSCGCRVPVGSGAARAALAAGLALATGLWLRQWGRQRRRRLG